jgi:uncharacterized membrane protein (UPF0127 family)
MMVTIYKNKKIVAKDAKLITSFIGQAAGLRFSKQKNLIFELKQERKEMIDMFFVFYPIDVIFLDKDKKTIELKRNLRPFGIYSPKRKTKYILELKKGTIKESKLKVRDNISFKK